MNGSEHLPAIVLSVWDEGRVNLLVFTDWPTDEKSPQTIWKASVRHAEDQEQGTWHWPEPCETPGVR